MKLKLESGDTLTRRVWLCEGPHGSVVWAHVGRLRPRSANTAISRGALNVEWGQCSQNVDVNGPHHGRYQLMASSSLHCHRLVEWGRHNELEASMAGAVYFHVLRTLPWNEQIIRSIKINYHTLVRVSTPNNKFYVKFDDDKYLMFI